MVTLGSGSYTYEVEEGWGKLPDGWSFKECAAAGVDAQDNVYAVSYTHLTLPTTPYV